MERILPIEKPKSFDCYHDALTHHYVAPVFYDALKREISFAKREGNLVGVVKFVLFESTSEEQLLYFANELELAVRQHDLIARITSHEFAVLLRIDSEIASACSALVTRIKNVERRQFQYCWVITDGTKGLAEVLEALDNPQILRSSNSL
jgi:GGDEF domain-containing protein